MVSVTENKGLSNWLKFEVGEQANYVRKDIVVNEAAQKSYASGTILGVVSATGKYKIAVETAGDGSKTPAAIVINDATIAASTDTTIVALVKGPAVVGINGITLDTSYNDATKKATAYAALEALGINVTAQL